MSLETLPTSLKPIKAYLEQAKVRANEPIIAYHCRLYALQEAMAMRANIPKADMAFILGLMDACEAEKQALGEHDDAGILCENFAQALFQKSDDPVGSRASGQRTASNTGIIGRSKARQPQCIVCSFQRSCSALVGTIPPQLIVARIRPGVTFWEDYLRCLPAVMIA